MKGVFVGLCGLDAVYYSSNGYPSENTKTKIQDFSLAVGGPAANAAITYAKLGGKACLVTALGGSDESRLIKAKLAAHRVQVLDLIPDSQAAQCNVSFIFVNQATASRSIFSGQAGAVPAQETDWAGTVENARFLLYDGNLPAAEEKLLEYAKTYQKDLVIDAGSHKSGFPACFSYPNTTVISSESFQDPEGRDVFALKQRYGFRHAAKTRGEQGILLEDKGILREIAVPAVSAVDTLGAGDILHGAYCYYKYEKDLPIGEALKRAARVASLTVTQKGVAEGLDHALCVLTQSQPK